MEIVLLSARAVEGSPLYQLAKRVVNVDHGLRCAAPIGGVVEDGHQPVGAPGDSHALVKTAVFPALIIFVRPS